jgi:hypothetical protein
MFDARLDALDGTAAPGTATKKRVSLRRGGDEQYAGGVHDQASPPG